MDTEAIRDHVLILLTLLGEDPEREGLRGTPDRVARFWSEFLDYKAGTINVTFEEITDADQIIVVRGIQGWSMCEHHLLPFEYTVGVGYLPAQKVIGLSKIARIVAMYAHRLQLQERLTRQIADELELTLAPLGLGVVVKASHLCAQMRGVHQPCIEMVTSVVRGVFREKPEARAELFALLNG